MSYFPGDIPFMSKEELRENGIRIPNDVPNTNVGDTISRQEAIDVLDAYQVKIENGEENPYAWAMMRMSELPSAQPEIIRCKDCKYRMPYDWMFSETWQSQNMDDYPDDEIGCLYCDMAMKANDFCSRGERRIDG